MTDQSTASTTDKCRVLCWHNGPPCELLVGHHSAHAAPSVARQAGLKFIGPIPSSDPRHPPYTVTVHDDDRAECTCDAYTKYRRGQDCSHIKLVREALETP